MSAPATVTIVRKDGNFTVTLDNFFEITTTVTSSGADVESWVAETRDTYGRNPSRSVVGVGAEWCRINDENRVAVLKICYRRRCLIYRIIHAAKDDDDVIPHALAGFLLDDNFTFAGEGIGAINDLISKDHLLTMNKAVDLRDLAAVKTRRTEMKHMGLAGIADLTMGIRYRKPTSVTGGIWDGNELTEDQVAYASVDAFLSAEIGWRLSGF